jgi:uncharacterized spore protein YtfJ
MTTDRSMTLDEAERTARRAAGAGLPVGLSDGVPERLTRWVGEHAGVRAVFGETVRNGDTLVIPVARARWAVGGGGGGGAAGEDARPGDTAGKEARPDGTSGSGFGSGGGGGVMTDPVGYLEIRPDGAVFRPIGRRASPGAIVAGAIAIAIVLRALARFTRA